MVYLALTNDRIVVNRDTAHIVDPIVVRIIPVPVRGTTGG